jgi:hypothetical protein
MPQLAEQHGHKLRPAFEAAGMTLRFVLLHRGFELVAGEFLQHLRKDAAYSIHGGVLLWAVLDFLAETPLQPIRAAACITTRLLLSGSLARTGKSLESRC